MSDEDEDPTHVSSTRNPVTPGGRDQSVQAVEARLESARRDIHISAAVEVLLPGPEPSLPLPLLGLWDIILARLL